LLEVIYTLNGREYVTPKQLELEIQDELLRHQGRLNVIDLQPLLNVDLNHIQRKVDEIVKKNKQLQLVDGELIANYYLDNIAEEMNESLQGMKEIYLYFCRFSLNGSLPESFNSRMR